MGISVSDADIIDLLYAGAADPARLEEALLLAVARLGASGGNIHVVSKADLSSKMFLGRGAAYTAASVADYLGHWRHVNVHRDAMRAVLRQDPGHVFLCHEHFSDAASREAAYLQDFYYRIGERWLAGAVAFDDARFEVSVAFNRGRGAGPFDEEARRLIGALLPHGRRAAALAVTVAGLHGEKSALESGLMASTRAALLVDGALKIRWANTRAQALLSVGGAIFERFGRLSLRDAAAGQRLAQRARAAVCRQVGEACGDIVRLPTQDGVLEIEVTPATVPVDGVLGVQALALLMVRSIGVGPGTTTALEATFGLTVTEARLAAAVANGDSLETIAQRRGIQVGTLRKQLKIVFAKTGATRQVELAAIVWRLGG